MPGELDQTKYIMRYLFKNISPGTYVNIMPQYRPCGKAYKYDKLSESLSIEEFKSALLAAKEEGITRLDKEWYW